VQVQRAKLHVAYITIEAGIADTGAAVFRAADTEIVQMHAAPPEHDLQHGREYGQEYLARDEEATPGQGLIPCTTTQN
jgi:hypothetical protein